LAEQLQVEYLLHRVRATTRLQHLVSKPNQVMLLFPSAQVAPHLQSLIRQRMTHLAPLLDLQMPLAATCRWSAR